MFPLNVFIINHPKRLDRKEYIENVFSKKDEFKPKIISCIYHKKPNVSLWLSIKSIINYNLNKDFTIICEDDHFFNENYKLDTLVKNIHDCADLNADILLGGVSWFDLCYPVSENILWTNLFNGTQFMIVFNKFYDKILNSKFSDTDHADFFISSLSKNIFISSPPISRQKEFGYSDINSENRLKGRLDSLFARSENRIQILNKVKSFYS